MDRPEFLRHSHFNLSYFIFSIYIYIFFYLSHLLTFLFLKISKWNCYYYYYYYYFIISIFIISIFIISIYLYVKCWEKLIYYHNRLWFTLSFAINYVYLINYMILIDMIKMLIQSMWIQFNQFTVDKKRALVIYHSLRSFQMLKYS